MPADHPQPSFGVSMGTAVLVDGTPGIVLKFASPAVEVNVWLSQSEARELAAIFAHEPTRRAVRLGTSAGSKVHWSGDAEDRVYVLIGADEETWDVGLTLDAATIDALRAALAESKA